MDMRKLVGRNVLRVRLACGVTQEQLAEKSGHSQHYISGLERGARNPTVVSPVPPLMTVNELSLRQRFRRTVNMS